MPVSDLQECFGKQIINPALCTRDLLDQCLDGVFTGPCLSLFFSLLTGRLPIVQSFRSHALVWCSPGISFSFFPKPAA